MIGCLRRLAKLFSPVDEHALILSMENGVGTRGLASLPELMSQGKSQVQGVVLSKGGARSYGSYIPIEAQVIVHLTSGTRHAIPAYGKSVVCTLPEALRQGADCVSLEVNIGNELESEMLEEAGRVIDEAHQLGLPVLAFVHAKGHQIVNQYDSSLVGHCMQVGFEIGADAVCVAYSGDKAAFGSVVETCPIPVLVSGGPDQSDFGAFLKHAAEAVSVGAAGVCAGDVLFSGSDPAQSLDALIRLIHPKNGKNGKNGKKVLTK